MWLAPEGKQIHPAVVGRPPGRGRHVYHRCSHCVSPAVVPQNGKMTVLPNVMAWYGKSGNMDGAQIQESCQLFPWHKGVRAGWAPTLPCLMCNIQWDGILPNRATDLDHQQGHVPSLPNKRCKTQQMHRCQGLCGRPVLRCIPPSVTSGCSQPAAEGCGKPALLVQYKGRPLVRYFSFLLILQIRIIK